MWAQLVGQAARPLHNRRFGHGVDHAVAEADVGCVRSDIHNCAATPLAHAGTYGAADQHGAEDVSVEHRAHIVERDVERVIGYGFAAVGADVAAGTIDQYRDRPQRRLGLRSQRLNGCFVGDIAGYRHHLDAVAGDAGHDRVEVGRLAERGGSIRSLIMNRDRGAELGQTLGDRASQPAAGTGDQRDLTV